MSELPTDSLLVLALLIGSIALAVGVVIAAIIAFGAAKIARDLVHGLMALVATFPATVQTSERVIDAKLDQVQAHNDLHWGTALGALNNMSGRIQGLAAVLKAPDTKDDLDAYAETVAPVEPAATTAKIRPPPRQSSK